MTVRDIIVDTVNEAVEGKWESVEERITEIENKVDEATPQPFVNKHWCSIALALAAGAIGYAGHDGWGWCIFLIFVIEQ